MNAKSVDVTSLLVSARNNQPVALEKLAEKFTDGRFLVPLRTTQGVRNAPESLEEHGANLPAHYLSLADGTKGAVFFTNHNDVERAEKELSWRTDHGNLKCLHVSGKLMADYAETLFDAGAIDRVVLNPSGPNETHLSQGDLAAFGKGKPPSALSFHVGEVPLPLFVPPHVGDSFADLALSKADSFLKTVTKHLENLSVPPTVSGKMTWGNASSVKHTVIGGSETLNNVVSELFSVFSKLPSDASYSGLQVGVSKVGDDVQITANRPVPDQLMNEAHQAVKDVLAGEDNFHMSVDMSMSQFLTGLGATGGNTLKAPVWTPPVAAAPTKAKAAPAKTSTSPRPRATTRRSRGGRGSRQLDYIPLEPESSDESKE